MKKSILLLLAFLPLACTSDEDLQNWGPQADYWANLEALCGHELPGEATVVDPSEDFTEVELSIRHCKPRKIDAVLRVNGQRREVWTFTRSNDQLTLEHVDYVLGKDRTIRYGGSTDRPGSSTRQYFPTDQKVIPGGPPVHENLWTLSFEDDRLVYQLRRSQGLIFELQFDTSETPVSTRMVQRPGLGS